MVQRIIKQCGRPIGGLIGDGRFLRGLRAGDFTDEQFGLTFYQVLFKVLYRQELGQDRKVIIQALPIPLLGLVEGPFCRIDLFPEGLDMIPPFLLPDQCIFYLFYCRFNITVYFIK